jgi:hypothetical protein
MKIMSSSSLTMKPPNTIINHILEIVALAPGCHLKYVAQLLPDLTLREVFHTLWYLNRIGQLDLKMDKHEGLTVSPSPRLFN